MRNSCALMNQKAFSYETLLSIDKEDCIVRVSKEEDTKLLQVSLLMRAIYTALIKDYTYDR